MSDIRMKWDIFNIGKATSSGKAPAKQSRRGLNIYIAAVTMAAADLFAAVAVYRPFAASINVPLAAVFGALIWAAWLFPIRLTPKTKVYVFTPPLLAMAMLFPPMTVIGAAVGGTAAAQFFIKKASWSSRIFNTAQTTLFAGAVAMVFSSLFSLNGPHALASAYGVLCAVAGFAVMYLVNSLVVSGAAGLQLHKSLFTIWKSGNAEAIQPEIALASFGLAAAMVIEQISWAILLMVVPIIVIYYLFRKTANLNEKVQHQLVELEATQAQLVETARMASIGTMVAGIAHQINNPMFVIRGRAETLCQDGDEHFKTDSARKAVKVIFDMSDRVSRIVNSLLPDSHICEDGVACSDVNEVVRNTLLLLEPKLLKSRVDVKTTLAENLPLCLGDACEIQELLINLVDNACNAMPQGGKLSVMTRETASGITIRLSDTGTGISDENLKHIFSPFFSTRKGSGGVGLGLYVSKHIVEKHGGSITVDSHPGTGTVFTITLTGRTLKSGLMEKLEAGAKPLASGSGSRRRGP
jgi:signal transduction histidine kinase